MLRSVMRGHTRTGAPGQSETEAEPLPFRVLFVCLGNICRSPAAEILFRAAVQKAGWEHRFRADSCGTASYHIGSRPDSRMLAALKRAGYSYDGHRARQFCRADFARFDLIIPQDESNRRDILSLARTPEEAARVQPMHRWFPSTSDLQEVPDPYYGGESGFDFVVELLAVSTRRLLQELAV